MPAYTTAVRWVTRPCTTRWRAGKRRIRSHPGGPRRWPHDVCYGQPGEVSTCTQKHQKREGGRDLVDDPPGRRRPDGALVMHLWLYGPITLDQHLRWRDQRATRWYWAVLEVWL